MIPRPLSVAYSEAAYFDGFHVQHIADYLEQKRLARIDREARAAARRMRNGR